MLKTVLKWVLAGLFAGSGVLHFVAKPTYVRLMPPALPYPERLVEMSGVVEAALGVALLFPRTQKIAAWLLIPTLIAIFPANIYGALTAGTQNEAMPGISPVLAWLRLPLQAVLIAWAYWYTQESKGTRRVAG